MKTLNEKVELAKEAIELIKEFNKVQESIKEVTTSNFEIIENEEGIISISFEEDFTEEEFELSRIYEVFKADMEGCGYFYEMLEEEKSNAEWSYGRVSKEEYIQRVGNISYMEKRSEEIYDRLKEISNKCK